MSVGPCMVNCPMREVEQHLHCLGHLPRATAQVPLTSSWYPFWNMVIMRLYRPSSDTGAFAPAIRGCAFGPLLVPCFHADGFRIVEAASEAGSGAWAQRRAVTALSRWESTIYSFFVFLRKSRPTDSFPLYAFCNCDALAKSS